MYVVDQHEGLREYYAVERIVRDVRSRGQIGLYGRQRVRPLVEVQYIALKDFLPAEFPRIFVIADLEYTATYASGICRKKILYVIPVHRKPAVVAVTGAYRPETPQVSEPHAPYLRHEVLAVFRGEHVFINLLGQ